MKKYFLIVMMLICFLGYTTNKNQKTENTKSKKVLENQDLKNLKQDLKRITDIIIKVQSKKSYKLEEYDKDVFKIHQFYNEDKKEFFEETTKLLMDLFKRIESLNYGEEISKTKRDSENTYYECSIEIFSEAKQYENIREEIYSSIGCLYEYGGVSAYILMKKEGERYYISDLKSK